MGQDGCRNGVTHTTDGVWSLTWRQTGTRLMPENKAVKFKLPQQNQSSLTPLK